MTATPSADHYAAIFGAVPVALLLLDPELVMVEANAVYLDAVGLRREDIVGHYVFEVFPNSPNRDGIDQAGQLYDTMRRAVTEREAQTLTGFRYDIPNRLGGFDIRVWNVNEVPLLDSHGEVEIVLHYTEDVTELYRQREARAAATAANEQLQVRVAEAQADLLRRADELEVLNARLRRASEHDRSVAEALQQALLTRLPDAAPLHLSARYRAAAEGDQVGGDWYDAIPLPHGGTAVMIGDVVGHDINAAALMGQLRSMMRAFTWATEHPPSAVMSQLDRAMRDLKVPTYASAILATIAETADTAGTGRTGDWTVTFTNAGHPPPILIEADGSTSVVSPASPCMLLGVSPATTRLDHEISIRPGAALFVYTDGLVERRGSDIVDGIERLRAALYAHRDLDIEARIDAVLDEMVGPQPEDDVAALLVELAPTHSEHTNTTQSGIPQ
jgi:PAS domain S-box-containing protein